MTLREKSMSAGLLWLRILAGVTIARIGYAKIFEGQMAMLIPGLAQMGFPAPAFFAWLAALSEFAGGICIALGLGTRIAALFFFVTMNVACWIAMKGHPFQDRLPAFLYGTIAGTLIMTGGGRFALESLFCRCKDDGACAPKTA